MKDGIFVSLKIPEDFKKRANFKPSHVDAKSFSQPFLRVKGSLGTNWGSFKAFNTSGKEVWLLNAWRLFLMANGWRGKQAKRLQQRMHLFG